MSKQWALGKAKVSPYAEWMMLRLLCELDGAYLFFQPQQRVRSKAEQRLRRMNGMEEEETVVFCWSSNAVARALGLPEELAFAPQGEAIARVLLDARWQAVRDMPPERPVAMPEATDDEVPEGPGEPRFWAAAYTNLHVVAEALALDAVEIAVLRLVLHLAVERPLRKAGQLVSADNFSAAMMQMAHLLDVPRKALRRAVGKRGKLRRYGLLSCRDDVRREVCDLEDALQWGDLFDADDFVLEKQERAQLLRSCLLPVENATLVWDDFAHIGALRETLLHYLRHAFAGEQRGVNVLLYGAPGTGKSQFAAALARELAVPCFAPLREDDDGDPLDGEARLCKAQVAQSLLGGDKALLVFDEVEDVFAGALFTRSVAQSHKGWVNALLETNPVPMVWISNDVSCMDPAFVRRFDIVLEMPDLPVVRKEALFRARAVYQPAAAVVRRFAEQEGLSPAVLTRTLHVANTLAADADDLATQCLLLCNQTLQAQGRKPLTLPPTGQVDYALDWVACDADLAQISAGLVARRQGRICCYGPPGTGKSAWAQWLGRQADMPVLLRRGSDLLGMYVGETERNIATAFHQAEAQGMLLVLDEVDGFLFAREGAVRSWERSMVNELLTQIERFPGLLVVSTNMLDALDAAALRRFDVKLHFGFLRREQVLSLAGAQAQALGLALGAAQQQQLAAMSHLTPGDFAAVARRHRFAPFADDTAWVAALAAECTLKPQAARKMGFI
ncbi:AAA family ATPase [uncultured Cardiobacterium sp.]|uniref:AAA family ATPase n=1 Tax=uncultured Cardiobacterium sp. TaxID=417619 RepID=UPI00260CBD1F|nr:AAA family ATPase [uncultured Cardiobacterium sp.]